MDEKERSLLEEWKKGFGYVYVPGAGREAKVTIYYNFRENECEATIDFANGGFKQSEVDLCVDMIAERPGSKHSGFNKVDTGILKIITEICFSEKWDFDTIMRNSLDMIAGALHARMEKK